MVWIVLTGDAGIERCRLELGVPEQNLDNADASAFCSSRWVAKSCRKVCGDTRQAVCRLRGTHGLMRRSWRADIGLSEVLACRAARLRGRDAHHQSRNWFEQRSCGESIT